MYPLSMLNDISVEHAVAYFALHTFWLQVIGVVRLKAAPHVVAHQRLRFGSTIYIYCVAEVLVC